MATEAELRAQVYEVEYAKEGARLIAESIVTDLPLEDFLRSPADVATTLTQALVLGLGPILTRATTDAAQSFGPLGIESLPLGGIDAVRDVVTRDFVTQAVSALRTAGESAAASIREIIGSAASSEVIQAALSSTEVRIRVLGSIIATIKRLAARLIQQIRRAVMETAMRAHESLARATQQPLPVYSWVTLLDGRVCKGDFAVACQRRHGRRATFTDWKSAGLPGSPTLRCNGDCRCLLSRSRENVPVAIDVGSDVKRAKEAARERYGDRPQMQPVPFGS